MLGRTITILKAKEVDDPQLLEEITAILPVWVHIPTRQFQGSRCVVLQTPELIQVHKTEGQVSELQAELSGSKILNPPVNDMRPVGSYFSLSSRRGSKFSWYMAFTVVFSRVVFK